ncbi:hypothetical protein G7046_g5616 [Stylonectria norvegica]|nr:hypothetical protein G7046_g5616 [Stylonectria norvegica]
MAPLNILISGAGIAGPALAFWLSRLGHSCTIVERFDGLRTGGQQIDLRGQGIEAVKRMGLLDEIRKHVVDEGGLQFVDTSGAVWALFGKNDTGKGRQSFTSEFEIMRGELCKIFYDATKEAVTYRFGISIDGFENLEDGVQVKFSDGTEERYDLLVAADGQGSRIRRMLFQDQPELCTTRDLGVYAAFYAIPRLPEDKNLATVYHAPDRRVISTRWHSEKQGQAYLLTMSQPDVLREALKKDVSQQKEAFGNIFKDVGWQASRVIEAMYQAEDFYAQPLVQLKSTKWSKGRVVLLGDAGYAPSPLTGMGTSLAVVGACVLAGELGKHGDDVDRALEAYDETLRPFVDQSQYLAPGVPGIAYPRTAWGIRAMYSVLGVVTWLGVDKMLAAVLPESKGKWRIPEYKELQGQRVGGEGDRGEEVV